MNEINPINVTEAKPWWKSKVIWFNGTCAALTALEASMHFIQPYIPGNVYGWILLFVTMANAFLRIITSQAIMKPQINGLFSAPKRPDSGFTTMEFLPYIVVFFGALGLFYVVYSMGVDAERNRWEKAESKKLIAANQKILDLRNQNYDQEQQHIKEMDDLTARTQQEKKAYEDEVNAVNAKLLAGTLKLRIATVRSADCGSTSTETSPATGLAEKTSTAELAPEASEFLIQEATERDKLAISFNACIEQLHHDRGLPFTNPYQTGEVK